jgi:hypothetical protein
MKRCYPHRRRNGEAVEEIVLDTIGYTTDISGKNKMQSFRSVGYLIYCVLKYKSKGLAIAMGINPFAYNTHYVWKLLGQTY